MVLKGLVQPKIKLPSSCIHPEVVPNLYVFLSSAEHNEDILKNVGSQKVSDPIDAVGPTHFWLPTFFKISYSMFNRRKNKGE